MFLFLLLALFACLVGVAVRWLHRRIKKLETALNVDTPAFPVTRKTLDDALEARIRKFVREGK